MTLTDFLLARIAEDEAVARGSGVVAWLTYRHPDGSMDHTEVAAAAVEVPDAWVSAGREAEGFASAKVIYDERRVLAECESKRAIVALHAAYPTPQEMTYGTIIACSTCGSVDDSPVEWPCDTLRLLAQPYADHPDFDPAWRD